MCGSPIAPPVEVIVNSSRYAATAAVSALPFDGKVADVLQVSYLAVAFGEFRRNDAK